MSVGLRETSRSEMKRVMVDSLHPLRFEPIFKRLVWGGRKLATVLGKPIGEGSEYAESWEISDHRGDVSRVLDGPLAGSTLRELIASHGEGLFGPAVGAREQFPLLVKFIDARQDLSVQVHPDDDLGRRLANDNGKTETWVIVHADPGSKIYAGLKPGTTREAMARRDRPATVETLLHSFEARAGDCILIPAGTVHAIGAGWSWPSSSRCPTPRSGSTTGAGWASTASLGSSTSTSPSSRSTSTPARSRP